MSLKIKGPKKLSLYLALAMSASMGSSKRTKAAVARPLQSVNTAFLENPLARQSPSMSSSGIPSSVCNMYEARDHVTSGGLSQLGLNTRPTEVVLVKQDMKECMQRKALHDVCVYDLFAKVKFINRNGREMDYSTYDKSICQFVISKCNLDQLTDPKAWWETHRKVVVQKITAERSNRSAAMRWGFYGKFVCIL